jgi:hypothetical protein
MKWKVMWKKGKYSDHLQYSLCQMINTWRMWNISTVGVA